MEHYEIEIQGELGLDWKVWFPGMEFLYLGEGRTKLTGNIADQTALHSMIARIRDLGIPLLRVERITALPRPENT